MTRPASEANLPKTWRRFVKSALLHVIALAEVVLGHVHGKQHASGVDRVQVERGLVQRQLRLVSTRLARVPPRHRPHYTPTERLEILELRAARGWNVERAADTLVTTPETITTWLRRVDEEGTRALVETIGRARHCVESDRVHSVTTCASPRRSVGRENRGNSLAKNRCTGQVGASRHGRSGRSVRLTGPYLRPLQEHLHLLPGKYSIAERGMETDLELSGVVA